VAGKKKNRETNPASSGGKPKMASQKVKKPKKTSRGK
jgi:hypothetical protein